MTTTLHAPPALWDEIRDDLLATPNLERAAVGFAGICRDASGDRLLLRDWIPVAQDEYLVQLAYHLEVSPAFWARHVKRARQTGEALVVMHSHPGDDHVPSFSPSDDAGERTLLPKIHSRARIPVAAVVVSPGGYQARITEPGASSHPLRLMVGWTHATPSARDVAASDRFDRQLRVLGRDGQRLLCALTVGVVGTGGLGSHVVQQLIHLGIGNVIVIDPDRVAASNLSRLVGASRWDALLHRHKTTIARRLARRVGGPTAVTELRESVTDEVTARRLLTCDVVIGCTDNQWSRSVLNAIAYQYYISVIDLGVELQLAGAMGGRVTWLAPGSPCLWCMGVLRAEQVRAEQLPRETLTDEVARGYLQGLDELAPAVVSINGVIASTGVTELLARSTGFAGTQRRASQLLYRLSDGVIRRTSPPPNPHCATCSKLGQLGLADLGVPPWTPHPVRPT